MQAPSSVIYFPKQSKPASKKHPKEKCTVLEWIRHGYHFPGMPFPTPVPKPPKPDDPPKPEPGDGGAQ